MLHLAQQLDFVKEDVQLALLLEKLWLEGFDCHLLGLGRPAACALGGQLGQLHCRKGPLSEGLEHA